MDPRATADALRDRPLVDSGWLTPDGARAVEAAAGDRARIVLAPRGTDLRTLRPIWSELGLDPDHDLLLLYNGERWEARGWGLDEAAIAEALDAAEGELAADPARALVAALDGLDAARPAPVWPWVAGPAGAVALGLGWLAWRRGAVARAQITDAKSAAELAYANLILDADGLAFDLQEKATRLRGELDRAIRLEADPTVRLGRIRQVEDEITALHSTVRQRRKETR